MLSSNFIVGHLNTWLMKFEKGIIKLEKVQRNMAKKIKQLENVPYEEQLKMFFLLGEEKA